MTRLRTFARHFAAGVRYRIPLCCVLRFAATYAMRGPGARQAATRGLRRARPRQYVPCLVFHRAEYASGADGHTCAECAVSPGEVEAT